MPRRAIRHFFVHIVMPVLILLLLAGNGVLLWVATGPRSLTEFNHYFETALSSPTGEYKVSIGDTVLIWEGWERPIDLRVRQVEIHNAEGQTLLILPQLSLGIDIPSLLVGDVAFASIRAYEPRLILEQQPDHHIKLNLQDADGGKSPLTFEDMLKIQQSYPSLRPLRRLAIINGYLALHDESGKPVVIAPDSTIRIYYRANKWQAHAEAGILFGDAPANVAGEASWDPSTGEAEASVETLNFDPRILQLALPEEPRLKQLMAPVSGKITVRANTGWFLQDGPDEAEFDVTLGKGTIALPEVFEETLPVSALAAKGSYKRDPWEVRISGLSAQLDGPEITASAHIFREEGKLALQGKASAKNASVKELHRYWPVPLAPKTRRWVLGHFIDGVVPHAEVTLNIRPGEFDQPGFMEDSISSDVEMKDVAIRYFKHHAEVRNLSGKVHFTGKDMTGEVADAEYLGAKLTGGKLLMKDLHAEEVWMDMDTAIAAPAKAIAQFLQYPELKHLGHLNIRPENVEGSAEGQVKLHFRVFSPGEEEEKEGPVEIDEAYFRYDITGKLSGAEVKAFQKRLDVSGLNSEVALNNDRLNMKGALTASGVPLEMEMENLFKAAPESLRYQVKTTAPVEKLIPLGFPKLEQLKGTVGLDADIVERGAHQSVDVTLDAKEATLDLSDYGWLKKPGEAATVKIKLSGKEDGPRTIESFSLSAGENRISGKGKLNADDSIAELNLPQVRLGKTDLSLDWTQKDKIDVITVKGEAYDLSQMLSDSSHERGKKDMFRNLDVTLDLKRLISGEKAELANLRGHMRCGEICTEAKFDAIPAPGKTMMFVIGSASGKRSLEIASNDAGALLRSLDIYDTMQGGTLSVRGIFHDDKKDHPLIGRATISEHHITEAPVLAKILSIATITGIPEALSGKGFVFSKLAADFEYRDRRILVKNAKSAGPSLGITFEGMVDMQDGAIDLSGTVVPANVLNSLFSDIPLIGMLAGGDGGIIATNYSVKGKYDSPSISVNPLSMLTPGFTRNFFDIFDTPPSFEDYDEEGNKIEKEQPTMSPSAKERRRRPSVEE